MPFTKLNSLEHYIIHQLCWINQPNGIGLTFCEVSACRRRSLAVRAN